MHFGKKNIRDDRTVFQFYNEHVKKGFVFKIHFRNIIFEILLLIKDKRRKTNKWFILCVTIIDLLVLTGIFIYIGQANLIVRMRL